MKMSELEAAAHEQTMGQLTRELQVVNEIAAQRDTTDAHEQTMGQLTRELQVVNDLAEKWSEVLTAEEAQARRDAADASHAARARQLIAYTARTSNATENMLSEIQAAQEVSA